MTLTAVASKLYGKHGVGVQEVGKVDSDPFKPGTQGHPGENIFDCVDRLCRMKGATLELGPFTGSMLLIGEHSDPVVQDLVEGENIFEDAVRIISNEMLSQKYDITGQAPSAEKVDAGAGGPRSAAPHQAR